MILGYFDQTGSPAIEITVGGIIPTATKKFQAIIDTGFTGFLQIPLFEAFGLALVLDNLSVSTLADGSQVNNLICLGKITVGPKTTTGFISLSTGGQSILLGTQWLDRMEMELHVDCKNKKVSIVPFSPTIPPSES